MMAEGKIIDVAVKKTSTGYSNNINHKQNKHFLTSRR